MKESSPTGIKILMTFLVIVMVGNVLILARSLELLRFPGEITDTEVVRGGARVLAAYYEKTIADAGLSRNSAVRDALAKFKFEVEQAGSGEEIAQVIWAYGRTVQDVIAREEENLRREFVLWVVNQDPVIKEAADRTIINVSLGKDGLVYVNSEGAALSETTVTRLTHDPSVSKLSQPVDIEVMDGKAQLLTPRTIQDAMRVLQSEIITLRANLENLRKTAGYSELEGQGITVQIYDARSGAYLQDEVVQEKDVRDMINELFSAGAVGIEVGGRRLIATSSIRSAGPLLLVDQQPISVNPVVIRAVGDPVLLESSLELIKNSLKPWGILVEVEKEDNLTLSAFRGEGFW
ncbi:MAG: DUF881 domain-containing protein [Firmicutes bacterium]|nr:DUF881 domain-containing protein [Bacillota bacterium]